MKKSEKSSNNEKHNDETKKIKHINEMINQIIKYQYINIQAHRLYLTVPSSPPVNTTLPSLEKDPEGGKINKINQRTRK